MFRRNDESLTMANERVKYMTRANSFTKLAIATAISLGLVACGGEEAEKTTAVESSEASEVVTQSPDVSLKTSDEKYDGKIAKTGSPYIVSYRIIGTPVVGVPVVVELRIESNQGSQPLNLDYRINDATAMMLGESQPARVRMELAANESDFTQQVTIIPQREGRFYLNVSASFETVDGTMSTVTAIPIQVGTGTRELQPHGEVQLDENGEAVRVLDADS
jgi:hypothetical protein